MPGSAATSPAAGATDMLDAAAVEAYLHDRIPLSRLMGVRVSACDELGVRLYAPLAPNINHRGTVFGGSASAVAMLCGWALVHARIADLPFKTGLVIRRNQMQFDHPIDDDFEAWCQSPDEDSLAEFDAALAAGKARLELAVELYDGDRRCATFRGVYVAMRN
ncbi:MAG TPA: thioesterase [Candidatus Latescibacteria bacterium]|nr:thioesterase [Candidatus Latescibacterota bacterium]